MSGLGIAVYTDEDADPSLAEQLNRIGYDALSCQVAGDSNQGLSDEWQLTFATQQRRAIVVFNARHFIPLDLEWRVRHREHYGIIVAPWQMSGGELVRRLRDHLDTMPPELQYNIVLWL